MKQVNTPRGTAFSVAFNENGAKKPKAKAAAGSFKFLKKDEGQRAVVVKPDGGSGQKTPRGSNSESAAFRAKIAADRSKDRFDHFAGVEVAVPKNAPPADRSISPSGPASRDLSPEGAVRFDEPIAEAPRSREPSRKPLREVPPVRAEKPDTSALDEDVDETYQRSLSVEESAKAPPARTRPVENAHASDFADDSAEFERRERRQPEPRGRHELLRTHLPREQRRPFEPDDLWDDVDNQPSRGQRLAQNRNYFGGQGFNRAADRRSHADAYEDELLFELEQEREALVKEKKQLHRIRSQLEREKQRFEGYKEDCEAQLDEERERISRDTEEERRAVRKLQRQVDEQRRQQVSSASSEKENVKRLQHENEQLRDQLEQLNSDLREREKVHKAELVRLRRDIASLTTRNAELLDLARQQQVQRIHSTSGERYDELYSTDSHEDVPKTKKGNQHSRYDTDDAYQGGPSDVNEQDQSLQSGGSKTRRFKMPAESEDADSDKRAKREKAAAELEDRMLREERERAERLERERDRIAKERQMEEEARAKAAAEEEEEEDTGRDEDIEGQSPSETRLPPTVEELVDDDEPYPEEDIPGDVVIAKSEPNENGKREVLYKSGKRVIFYSNGTRKEIMKSGHLTLFFANGDKKRTFPSGKSTYNYAEAQTTHTQLPNGVQIFQFHTGNQTEKHHPDGTKEILYPDGIYKIIHADGTDETVYPDGVVEYGQS